MSECEGGGNGESLFWDHKLTNGTKDTFLVSNSFSDFIQSLFVEEDSDEEDDGILNIELDDDLPKQLNKSIAKLSSQEESFFISGS
ncbi:hypothetical protein [Bacillus velezensis]|uniref:hypothetical protein n=1 Tax=Bacillus velezensis TaxID=492670 RepID=UPI001E4B3EE2|nr:hypothetical protein [Bacillus velezensis]USQ52880.1 hypothetical protein NG745_14690 [Bacillus velezensis]UUY37560.1 hypothetical protein NSY19_14585 [Bacillus velezensis]